MIIGISTEASAVSEITTRPFSPTPITITLEDLPKPFASESVNRSPYVTPPPDNAVLMAPPGFKVNLYAENLDHPRWLAVSPEGDLLVTETPANRILRLRDMNGDGVADMNEIFADSSNGLNKPFGMAFSEDAFFVGNTNGIYRYPYKKGQGTLSGKGEKLLGLPVGGHWTRNVILSKDGNWIYVAVGSASNVAEEKPPRATILRMRLDGTEKSVYASGLRNPVGLAVHPITGVLYTVVNERDALGDDLVPDYFTSVREGGFYGWPYAYLAPGNLDPRMMKKGESMNPDMAAKTITPDVLFESHSAVMSAVFVRGGQFPKKYRGGALVAMRGSWNRSHGTGYKIVFVPFTANKPVGYYEDFITGFLTDPKGPETWGRPVGGIFMPDGSYIFAEEANSRLYRVSYSNP